MRRVGLRELRLHCREVIERAKAGETIEVTDRGRPVARLVPIREPGRYEQLVAEGRIRPGKGNLLNHSPLPSDPAKPSLTELLMQERDSYYEDP